MSLQSRRVSPMGGEGQRTRIADGRLPGSRLTATATATGYQQRPATAHNSGTIRANSGYVRPEKQTVEDQRRSAATVANTVAKPLNNTRRTWTTLEYRPSPRPVTDGPGRLAHSYGSEGSRMAAEEPAALRCPHCPRREVSGMAGPGDKMAATAAGRGHRLRKWKCYLGRHDYVQDRWDRPRGGPPPKTQTCLRCGKRRDPDALMRGAPWVGGP